jgi:hypothetical protein
MNLDADKWLSIITGAAIAGLVVLNWDGATNIIKALGGVTVDYVRAIQGRN